jgi:hypothetical protein
VVKRKFFERESKQVQATMQKHVNAARAEAALQSRLATVTEPTGSGAYSTSTSSSRGSNDATAAAATAGGGSSNGHRPAPCSPGEVFMSGFSRAVTEVRHLVRVRTTAAVVPSSEIFLIVCMSRRSASIHACWKFSLSRRWAMLVLI